MLHWMGHSVIYPHQGIPEGLFFSFALSRLRTQFSLQRSSQPILFPQSFSFTHLFVAGVLQRRCQGGRGGLSQDRQSWPTFSPSATFLSQLPPFLRSTFSSTILLGILHPVCWILLSATRIGGDNSAIFVWPKWIYCEFIVNFIVLS